MNKIWKLCYNTIRCHTEKSILKNRLLRMRSASAVNTYFDSRNGNKTVGWDVDVSLDKLKNAERILKTKCDHSTTCREVSISPLKFAQKRRVNAVESI